MSASVKGSEGSVTEPMRAIRIELAFKDNRLGPPRVRTHQCKQEVR